MAGGSSPNLLSFFEAAAAVCSAANPCALPLSMQSAVRTEGRPARAGRRLRPSDACWLWLSWELRCPSSSEWVARGTERPVSGTRSAQRLCKQRRLASRRWGAGVSLCVGSGQAGACAGSVHVICLRLPQTGLGCGHLGSTALPGDFATSAALTLQFGSWRLAPVWQDFHCFERVGGMPV